MVCKHTPDHQLIDDRLTDRQQEKLAISDRQQDKLAISDRQQEKQTI